ncbi:MAG: SOS response-associated peptidase [Acidimicrobiia bacterium]
MCGRFVQASAPTLLTEHFDVDELVLDELPAPSYNVAPRMEVLAVLERDRRRLMGPMRWGLVPSWADDLGIGDRLINARAETLTEKPAYRHAFERRRCIIPADGFYEWQTLVGGKKHPVFIRARDGAPLAFAGLAEAWRDRTQDAGPWIRTCAVITTRANGTLAPVHDRMPVMLDRADWDQWLDRDLTEASALEPLLVPAPDDLLEFWPVSTRVNAARNDDARLIEREDPLTLFG